MARLEKVRLGDLLVQQKLISQDQLEYALDQQKRTGRKLGRVLVDNTFVTEENISRALAQQLSIPYINLKNFHLKLGEVRLLPESQARRLGAIVLEDRNGKLLIGMADPTDLPAFDEIASIVKRDIEVAVVTEGQLLESIDRGYRRTEEITGLNPVYSEDAGGAPADLGTLAGTVGAEDVSAVKFLLAMFDDAMEQNASDIHIEPQAGKLVVRFRIDGKLQLKSEADHKLGSRLMSRLKWMAGLDASENRLPLEGHFSSKVGGRAVDVHLSIMPTQNGESVVIHLLRQDEMLLGLDKLGMPADMLKRLREIIHDGNGMILVAGLADCGKTTTLYSMISEISSTNKKIITVEDPVEYRFPGINQVQVNEKADLTFSRVSHSILRQDPDVVLIGDLRDAATAQITLRAAKSGRLVLSTMFAYDAADAMFQLVDMGMPRFMVASAVQVVVAQRLLRRVCADCKEPHVPSQQESEWLKAKGMTSGKQNGLMHGRGCPRCFNTGYRGRVGAYEMLEMNRELLEAAAQDGANQFMQELNRQMRGKSLNDHAVELMRQGHTTIAEVISTGSHAGN